MHIIYFDQYLLLAALDAYGFLFYSMSIRIHIDDTDRLHHVCIYLSPALLFVCVPSPDLSYTQYTQRERSVSVVPALLELTV